MGIGIGYFPVNLALPIPILAKKADTTDTDTIGTFLLCFTFVPSKLRPRPSWFLYLQWRNTADQSHYGPCGIVTAGSCSWSLIYVGEV